MDMRSGDLYPTVDDARKAGVPEDECAEVNLGQYAVGEVVHVASGPFMGRIYQRAATGFKRRKDLEHTRDLNSLTAPVAKKQGLEA